MDEHKFREDRKNRQMMYKQFLDNQINFKNQMQVKYGNMTHVEKRINAHDLAAYKNFDNHQYSMIPGFSPFSQQYKMLENQNRYKKQDMNKSVEMS